MPDLQNFSVQPSGTVNVNVPRYTIECKIVDSSSGAVLHDFTGDNAVYFPGVLSTLTPEQRLGVLEAIAVTMVNMKAGL